MRTEILTVDLWRPADIQEYLLLKGVEAVAIHGSKSASLPPHFDLSLFWCHLGADTRFAILTAQEEREYAIKAFKSGKKDVMVASSVASKGLDFSEIQHVINYSMPKEIEVSFPHVFFPVCVRQAARSGGMESVFRSWLFPPASLAHAGSKAKRAA